MINFLKMSLKTKEAYEQYIKQYAPEFTEMFKGMADGATAAGVFLSYDEVLAHFVRRKTGKNQTSHRLQRFRRLGNGYQKWPDDLPREYRPRDNLRSYFNRFPANG